MLEIIQHNEPALKNDFCFAFSGHKAIINPKGSSTPWKRSALQSEFGTIELGLPIGLWHSQPCYAVEIPSSTLGSKDLKYTSLYGLLGQVSDNIFSTYGRAFQFLNWRKDHQFCGRCGSRTELADEGLAMQCSSCALSNYPRISPCVIFLITRGNEILLATAKGRRNSFYSNLAGFIEAGETAEETIHREAFEEVGITLKNICYFGSQSWPFPGQLMLAYTAEYDANEINIDPREIEHAAWFKADSMPTVPPLSSISGQLIASFLNR